MRRTNRNLGTSLVLACTLTSMAFWVACSSSGDKDVSGGASGDMGIVADIITGDAQKGPFVKGSAVTVQGIDCKTMTLTDEHFEGVVKSDMGDFAMKDIALSSSCAVFEVTGQYRDELTGKKSAGEITLHALTNLKDRKTVNINVLTELEYERLMHLVTEEKMDFADAKKLAEKEVLATFGIQGDFDNSEDLTIFESGDGNAALLAVSVMMQAETDDAGLATRIDKFTDSFVETGKWKDDETKSTIESWQVAATADGTLDSIRKNVEGWGYADVVPAFEKYVEAFGDTVILSSDSGEESSSSSARSSSSCEKDCFDWSVPKEAYLNTNISYGEMVDARDGQVYKTVKIGEQTWMAENLNYVDSVATPSLLERNWCYEDDPEKCNVAGRLYTWAAAIDSVKLATDKDNPQDCGYGKDPSTCALPDKLQGICPSGWHLPDTADWKRLFSVVGGKSVAGKMLKSKIGWRADGNGIDSVGFSAIPAGYRSSKGDFFWAGGYAYFWIAEKTDFDWREVYLGYNYDNERIYDFAAEMGNSIRCIKNDSSLVRSSSSSLQSSSSTPVENLSSSIVIEDPGSEYDASANTLKDLRDGKTYRTTNIGGRVWMAENLNYETPNSYCYNDSAEYCETYGRLYTIAAAVDSIGAFGSAGKGCGFYTNCSLEGTVRGVCPSGWHLPDADEWKALFIIAGADVKDENPLRPDMNAHRTFKAADKLMSKSGWGHVSWRMGDKKNIGTDDFGFSVLPAGYRIGGIELGSTAPSLGPLYDEPGGMAGFLYVYERPGDSTFYGWNYNYAWILAFIGFYEEDYDVKIGVRNKDDAYSVRCVMDGVFVMPSSSSSVASSSSISSSSSSGSFDWSLPKGTYLNPNIEYDSIVDSRDGKVYKTVKIGDQTWMAENLNYDPGQGGSGDAKYDWSWCFNNEPKNCDVAGRLYTWAAAIDSVKLANDAENPRDCGDGKACYLSSTVQGICDKGWHLPTRMEWKALFTAVGDQSTAGVVLKSQVGWYNDGNGTDAFGFSALPAGYSIDKDHFYDAGLFADFWSSTEYASKYAYDMYMKYNFEDALVTDFNKSYGYSVRCVKD